MIYCTNCGNQLSETSKFCSNCGNKIEEKPSKEFIQQTSESTKEMKTDDFWNKLKIDEKQIEILSDFGTGPDWWDLDEDEVPEPFPNHIQKIRDCFCLTIGEIEKLEKLSTEKRGVIKYPDEEIYIGEINNGIRSGFGVYFEKNEDEDEYIMTYNGFWVDDKREGKGFQLYDTLLRYKGEWENDSYNGNGIWYESEKSRNIGNYKNGSLHGEGTLLRKDGSVDFEGNFKDGLKHGYGVGFFINPVNIKLLEGEWSEDKFIKGDQYHKNGSIEFSGNFEDTFNFKNGKMYSYEGVLIYEGEFGFEDEDELYISEPHGWCIEYYQDGEKKYEGNWEKGLYHGEGIYFEKKEKTLGSILFKKKEKTYEGIWFKGEFINSRGISIENSHLKPIDEDDNNDSPIKPKDGAGIR